MIYNGFWWATERLALQTLIDQTSIRQRLGAHQAVQRQCDRRIARLQNRFVFDMKIATFDEDEGAYNQADAAASSSSMLCACGLR